MARMTLPHAAAAARRDPAPRRAWSRRALETSGISAELLRALDAFTRDVPPIPTQLDLSRKIPVRNMRKWIADLETPAHAQLWASLVDVLRRDSSVESAFGTHWDHAVCRFILGVLVSAEDASKTRADRKQSRQAVNNAIKRELTCPIESGSSSRSKTFRDLFREKCAAGGVKLPQLESAARGSKHVSVSPAPSPLPPPVFAQNVVAATLQAASSHLTASTATATASATPTEPSLSAPSAQWYDPFAIADPLPSVSIHSIHKKPSEREATTLISRCRDACPATAEWGQTAWWELRSDRMVFVVPFLLAVSSLFELRALLLDFRWLRRTFQCVDYNTGMRQVPTMGYDALLERARIDRSKFPHADIEGFRLIRNALMLTAPILAKDSAGEPKDRPCLAHLATQLVGRLLNLKRRFPNIATLLQSIEAHAPRPWLRPLATCFQEPRIDIKIAVPSNGFSTPHLVALSDDGRLLAVGGTNLEVMRKEVTASTLVSSSKEKKDGSILKVVSIRLWDVESGKLLLTIKDIPSVIYGLSIAKDQSCVTAYTFDNLFFWPLKRCGNEFEVRGRVDADPKPRLISSVTSILNSSMVLTTTRSKECPVIRAWNTRTGKEVASFVSVKSRATCVDVSMDGEYFASGHDNGFVHLWHAMPFEFEPVLSFRNVGSVAEGGEQHVPLKKVNATPESGYRTVSISFFERGEKSWLATVSTDQVIRIWEIPPRSITREGRTEFVSSLRTAVLQCPFVQDVQWSQQGCLYSAGDDGVARMWYKTEAGKWKPRDFVRERREHSSEDVSSVFVSSGKRSEVVATYMTKSPYVTVWDMQEFGSSKEQRERAKLYKSYLSMIHGSVDASDIRHPHEIDKAQASMHSPTESPSALPEAGKRTTLKILERSPHDITPMREELEQYFRMLDVKNSTRQVGLVQPRLTLSQSYWVRPLEVCFEQPVLLGVSGLFRRPGDKPATQHSDRPVAMPPRPVQMPPPPVSALPSPVPPEEEEPPRRGMVVALQDGSIAIFEVEDRTGPIPTRVKSEEGDDVTATVDTTDFGGSSPPVNESKTQEDGEKKTGALTAGTSSAQTDVVVIDAN